MVSLMILIVGMLGLLVGLNVAMDVNTRNQLRDEAVQLADDRMRLAKSNGAATLAAPFNNLSATVTRSSRIRAAKTLFTIGLTSSAVGNNSSMLSSAVSWTYKSQPFTQELISAKQYP